MNFTHVERRPFTSGTCRIPIDSNMDISIDGIVGHIIFSRLGYSMKGEVMNIGLEVQAVAAVKLAPGTIISADPIVGVTKKLTGWNLGRHSSCRFGPSKNYKCGVNYNEFERRNWKL